MVPKLASQLVWLDKAMPKWDVKGQRNLKKFKIQFRSYYIEQEEREQQERERRVWVLRTREKLKEHREQREQQEQQEQEKNARAS